MRGKNEPRVCKPLNGVSRLAALHPNESDIRMDFLADFFIRFLVQFQSPTLGFLIGGMLIAALGSKLKIPNAIYQFVVFMLLMKIGLNGGIEIREANLFAMALPALFSILIGLAIVRVASRSSACCRG